MKYNIQMINNIRKILNDDKLVNTYRIASKDFTRNRKLTAKSIIYYGLNKKGLSSKMEIDNFIELANIPDVSLPAMLKQREKLNSDVFKYLNESTMEVFYVKNSNEVKTFDDYILTAVDGSDFEIPNTASTRETFNSYKSTLNNDVAARASISIQFDLLNKFVLDTVIKPDRTSEIEMMQENLKVSKQILRNFKTIRIMDRGYVSLADMYYSNANEDKFIVRLKNKDFKKERENHDTNDFVINIGYEYNRVKHYKDNNPEVYNYLLNGRFNKRKNCKYTIRYRGNRDTRY